MPKSRATVARSVRGVLHAGVGCLMYEVLVIDHRVGNRLNNSLIRFDSCMCPLKKEKWPRVRFRMWWVSALASDIILLSMLLIPMDANCHSARL